MAGGNKYIATIVNSSEEAVTVIIREVYQHPSQAGQTSFPSSRGPESLHVTDRMGQNDKGWTLENLEYEEAFPGGHRLRHCWR